MTKITVVGEEDFTLGFELVGIESFPLEKLESLFAKEADVGIVILSGENYGTLSMKLKTKINRSIKPIVVILSKEDIKGGNLREAVIRALGVDLLK